MSQLFRSQGPTLIFFVFQVTITIAVVVAFFICWAPFHAQRLLAVYGKKKTTEFNEQSSEQEQPVDGSVVAVYQIVTYVSGVLYYLSTTINPLLYNIMSNKFREAFKAMLSNNCRRKSRKSMLKKEYSSISRYPKSTIRRIEQPRSVSVSACEDMQKIILRQPEKPCKQAEENSKKNPFDSNGSGKCISRGSSDISQTTTITTLDNPNGSCITRNNKDANCVIKNNNNFSVKSIHQPLKNIAIERLKFGSGGFYMLQQHKMKLKSSSETAMRSPKACKVEGNVISDGEPKEFDARSLELAEFMSELD